MAAVSMVMFTCTSKAPEQRTLEVLPSPSLERHKAVNEDVQNFTGGAKSSDDLNKEQRIQTEEVIRALGKYREQLDKDTPNKLSPNTLPKKPLSSQFEPLTRSNWP
jgi:hypothetical protein